MLTTFTATRLYVTTITNQKNKYEMPKSDTFPVYQFSNGAIMVLGQCGEPNRFFDSIEEFEPNGTHVVDNWADYKETEDFAKEDLKYLVKRSIPYYKYYSQANKTAKILELLSGKPINNND